MKPRTQQGFTLLEIAILIVIVGLILAGVIKGQEMITSAKVKRVAGQIDEIRAAYFGFQDRYKALPGDYSDADINIECGSSTCLKGDGDGRIRANDIPVGGKPGPRRHSCVDPLVRFRTAQRRLQNGGRRVPGERHRYATKSLFRILADRVRWGLRTGRSGVPRHQLKTGPQIPVEVVAELDRKTDDGKPYTGAVQFSAYAANGAPSPPRAHRAGARRLSTSLQRGICQAVPPTAVRRRTSRLPSGNRQEKS